MNKPPIQEEATIPLDRVAKFIRQLTHDVRNGLSAADLEAAFVEEISADAEVLAEVRKLREMIADTARMLRGVSLYFQPASVHPIPWEARLLLEELRKRVELDLPEQAGAIAAVADGVVVGSAIVSLVASNLAAGKDKVIAEVLELTRTLAGSTHAARRDKVPA